MARSRHSASTSKGRGNLTQPEPGPTAVPWPNPLLGSQLGSANGGGHRCPQVRLGPREGGRYAATDHTGSYLHGALLVSAAAAVPAQAKVPAPNSQIVFGRFNTGLSDFQIFTANPDGTSRARSCPALRSAALVAERDQDLVYPPTRRPDPGHGQTRQVRLHAAG